MQNRLRLGLLLLLASILFLSEAVLYLYGRLPRPIVLPRELLLWAVLLTAIPFIRRLKTPGRKDLLVQLNNLFFTVAGFYLLVVVLNILFKPFSYLLQFTGAYHANLYDSVGSYATGMGIAIGVALMLIRILFLLHDLILLKPKKFAARIFNLLLFFLAALVFHSLAVTAFSATSPGFLADAAGFLWFVFIALAGMNALRTPWVNVLHKRNKVSCILWGIPVVAGSILFVLFIARIEVVKQYSASLAVFIEAAGLFLAIYTTGSLLSLLLHLPTAALYDRRREEVKSLQELSRVLANVVDARQILEIITAKARAVTESDAMWFVVEHAELGSRHLVAAEGLAATARALEDIGGQPPFWETLMQDAAPILVNEVAKEPRLHIGNGDTELPGSLLCIPVIIRDRPAGVLYVGKREPFGFDDEERYLLDAFANQAAIAIENARLVHSLLAKERVEQELKIARQAQQKLLPSRLPQISGLSVDAVSMTANEVGGDYYCFFESDGQLGVVVADVSGKGAQAAFYMAELKGIIEAVFSTYTAPDKLMTQINEILYSSLDKQTYITLVYALIDVRAKKGFVARAGHTPPLHWTQKANVPKPIEPAGLGLGLVGGDRFSEQLEVSEIDVGPGDVLLFYTDGVTEAMNPSRVEFGDERLYRILGSPEIRTATELKNALVRELKSFTGASQTHDDLTFVVVKVGTDDADGNSA